MPGLFDSLDDFNESTESDFNIIPEKKIRQAVNEIRRERSTIDELYELRQRKFR